jgi:hypothetical protein
MSVRLQWRQTEVEVEWAHSESRTPTLLKWLLIGTHKATAVGADLDGRGEGP